MAYILCIETSSDLCSVAIAENNTIVASKTVKDKNSHSSGLALYINEILEESQLKISQLDAVAVSKGPGSFTGLRIGVSLAKGIAFSLDLPLIAVNTMKSLTEQVIQVIDNKLLYCPVIDAKNGELYCAMYDKDFNTIYDVKVVLPEEVIMNGPATKNRVIFFGDGIEKIKDRIRQTGGIIVENIKPEAKFMIRIASEKFNQKDFEDLQYFEPFYLKDFKARKSSEKIRRVLNR
jgi:tRNA threonylcarbamoyladenosine biosynthesis protein TsaB